MSVSGIGDLDSVVVEQSHSFFRREYRDFFSIGVNEVCNRKRTCDRLLLDDSRAFAVRNVVVGGNVSTACVFDHDARIAERRLRSRVDGKLFVFRYRAGLDVFVRDERAARRRRNIVELYGFDGVAVSDIAAQVAERYRALHDLDDLRFRNVNSGLFAVDRYIVGSVNVSVIAHDVVDTDIRYEFVIRAQSIGIVCESMQTDVLAESAVVNVYVVDSFSR